MACSKWEEVGLLYCSRELDQKESDDFGAHMEACPECKSELELYENEQKSFYTLDILSESPSKEVDAEILRVCTAKKQYTNGTFFSGFVKKVTYSVGLFLVCFLVVGYFTLNVQNANRHKGASTAMHPESQKNTNSTVVSNENDSILRAQQKDSAVIYSKNRGNLETKGVIPVDLK
jgi:hypothetical protein